MLNTIVNSVGIIAFACSGVFKGLKYNFDIFGITVLGIITACGGGIIRDILLNRIPLIFRKEIYATAAIAGGIVYILLRNFSGLSEEINQILTILLIVSIRTLAVKYHWQMPKFYGNFNDAEM